MSQRDKPRLALRQRLNITAGGREGEDSNRTREVGHLDEIQGVVANTLNLFGNGAVGFIDWLDDIASLPGVVLFKKSEWAERKYIDDFPAVHRAAACTSFVRL